MFRNQTKPINNAQRDGKKKLLLLTCEKGEGGLLRVYSPWYRVSFHHFNQILLANLAQVR